MQFRASIRDEPRRKRLSNRRWTRRRVGRQIEFQRPVDLNRRDPQFCRRSAEIPDGRWQLRRGIGGGPGDDFDLGGVDGDVPGSIGGVEKVVGVCVYGVCGEWLRGNVVYGGVGGGVVFNCEAVEEGAVVDGCCVVGELDDAG